MLARPFVIAALLLSSLTAPAAGATPSDPVRKAAFDRLLQSARRDGFARALVRIDVPHLDALTGNARRSRRPALSAAADEALARAIDAASAEVRAALAGTPHEVHRMYRTVPFLALHVTEPALARLEADPRVLGIHEDRPLPPALDGTVPLVGAPAAWDAGLDGAGWSVAVLDTGIRETHGFFAGKQIVQGCFASGTDMSPIVGDCPNGQAVDITTPDAARHHPSNFNFFDHGTNVAGVAVGSDPDPLNVPRYGVARGADLIAIQVYSRFESDPLCGAAIDCVLSFPSDQVAGLEHVFLLSATHDIAAVNMSIGSGRYFDRPSCDAAFAAIEVAAANLRAVGIPTVVASGNNGYCDSMNGPACVSSAVAVGATDDLDAEASFSNFHPAMLDLFAPGVSILTSRGTADGDYVARGGTSLAAPHVAGAWALLKQASPSATVDQVLASLQSTGEPGVAYRCGGGGPPRIRIAEAAGIAPAAPIPALGPPGVLVLGIALAVAGLAVLRRQTRRA